MNESPRSTASHTDAQMIVETPQPNYDSDATISDDELKVESRHKNRGIDVFRIPETLCHAESEFFECEPCVTHEIGAKAEDGGENSAADDDEIICDSSHGDGFDEQIRSIVEADYVTKVSEQPMCVSIDHSKQQQQNHQQRHNTANPLPSPVARSTRTPWAATTAIVGF